MKTNKRIKTIIATLAIAALILTGSAPYFAFAQTQNGEDGSEFVSLATYDDSKVPAVTAGSAVLMNAGNGDIIYEKNAHQVREPASVTKILNALVVVENLDMDQEVTVPSKVETRGTTVDLVPGEKLTVKELMYCMMMESGNDAAEVLGLTAGGDLKTFSKMMNARAKKCGAENTDFKNPNGLNERAGQLNYTTAYDLGVITKEVMKNEDFREVVSTEKHTVPRTNKSKARKLRNSNACLWDDKRIVEIGGKNIPVKYTGCTGVKTGYTSSAGSCFVGTAKRGNIELIAVVLNAFDSNSKFADAIKLWDYGFKHYDNYTAKKGGKVLAEQKVRLGALSKVKVGLAEDLNITVDKGYDAEGTITTEMTLKEDRPTAPIKEGQVMGTVKAYNEEGALVAAGDVVAYNEVEKGGPLSYIGIADEYAWIVYLALAAVLLIIVIAAIISRRKHPKKKVKKQPPKAKKQPKKKAKAPAEEQRAEEVQEQPIYTGSQRRPIAPPLSTQMPPSSHSSHRDSTPEYSSQYSTPQYTDYEKEKLAALDDFKAPPRPERTRAQKRKARKQRARRRKARNRNK